MSDSTPQVAAKAALPSVRTKGWSLRRNWERVVSILLLLPSVLALALFVYTFIGWTGFVSLTAWKGAAPDLTFVGLKNYEQLLVSGGVDMIRFHIDLRNMIGFTIVFLAACIVIGFTLAALLDRHIRAEGLFRSIFIFPMAISFIVTGVTWRWILTPGDASTGWVGVNLILDKIGLGSLKSAWFTDSTVVHITATSSLGQFLVDHGLGFLTSQNEFGYALAVTSLVIAATWQLSGYTMALYLAGLRSIPDELREAARVDGASEWQVYRYVILPLLTPVTLTVVIILGHMALKIYDLVVSMTGGEAGGFATDVPALNMWKTTFQASQFAQGAAIAVILLLMVATLIIPYLRSQLRAGAQA
jgi:glucose/mannose transport system permease protein